MNKQLILSAATAMLCAVSASAFDRAEILDAGTTVITFTYPDYDYTWGDRYIAVQNVPNGVTGQSSFTPTTSNASAIFLNNFPHMPEMEKKAAAEKFYMPIVINGTTFEFGNKQTTRRVASGSRVQVGSTIYYHAPVQKFYTLTSVSGSEYILLIPVNRNTGEWNNDDLTGTITKDADGNFTFTLDHAYDMVFVQNNYGKVCNTMNGGVTNNVDYFLANANYCFQYSGLVASTVKKTGTMTDTLKETFSGNGNVVTTNRSYDVDVKMADGKIEVRNFANMGLPYQTWLSDSKNAFQSSFGVFDGEYDGSTMEVYMKPKEVAFDFWSYGDAYTQYAAHSNMYTSRTYDPSDGEYLYEGIEGKLDCEEIEATYRAYGRRHPWHKAGTEAHMVLKKPWMTFDTFYIKDCIGSQEYDYLQFDNAKIQLDFDVDITHEASITPTHVGYGVTGSNGEGPVSLYIKGHINQLKHSGMVTGYELYIVPGHEHDPHGGQFVHNDVHPTATRIDVTEFMTHWTPEESHNAPAMFANDKTAEEIAAELNDGLNFNLLIPETAMQGVHPDGKYSIYLAAKYGNTPYDDSFHAMTPLVTNISGISDIAADTTDAPERWYNLSGVEVSANPTAPGVYIARRGNISRKVVVK